MGNREGGCRAELASITCHMSQKWEKSMANQLSVFCKLSVLVQCNAQVTEVRTNQLSVFGLTHALNYYNTQVQQLTQENLEIKARCADLERLLEPQVLEEWEKSRATGLPSGPKVNSVSDFAKSYVLKFASMRIEMFVYLFHIYSYIRIKFDYLCIRIKFVDSFICIKIFVYAYHISRLFVSKYSFICFSCPSRSGRNCRSGACQTLSLSGII